MSDRGRAILVTIILLPFLLAAVFFMPLWRFLQGYTGGEWSIGL